MTVRKMLAQIDSAELTEWRAYYALEPFGELVADQRHGIATATLANVNRDSKKKREAYQPNDFIYWHESHRNRKESSFLPDDPEEQTRILTQMFRTGGKG